LILVLEVNLESTHAAHRVAKDATARSIDMSSELSTKQSWQLTHNVRVHSVVLIVRLLSRVDVKACALSKIPGIVRVAGHVSTAR
jgi:hypothetical protein